MTLAPLRLAILVPRAPLRLHEPRLARLALQPPVRIHPVPQPVRPFILRCRIMHPESMPPLRINMHLRRYPTMLQSLIKVQAIHYRYDMVIPGMNEKGRWSQRRNLKFIGIFPDKVRIRMRTYQRDP